MADFALDLNRLCELATKRAEKVARKTVLAVGTSIVLKSPVGDPTLWKRPAPPGYVGGNFRRNWQYGFGSAKTDIQDGVDPTGSAAIAAIAAGVKAAPAAGEHFIANGLPYGPRLEFTGHSSQAPEGMVGITIVEFERYVSEAVKEAKA